MRTLLRLGVIALVLLLLLLGGVVLFLDRGAAKAVGKAATHALGVPTEVSSVSIRPFRGSVALSDLSVANPAGFSAQPCLGVGAASMQVELGSLMKDTVEVQSLELSDVRLRLEGRGTKTNYGVLLDNLKRLGGEDGGKPAPAPVPSDSESGKRFLVRELVIRNVVVEADYALDSPLGQLAASNTKVTLPEIRLHDVGNGKSLSLAELSDVIFRALLSAAGSGNIPGLSGDIAKDLQRSLAGFQSGAIDMGKQLENAAKELGRGLDSSTKDAVKGVKDLFKKN